MSQPDGPQHGALVRSGHRQPLRLIEMPPWHDWKWRSEASRVQRFIEEKLIVPTGAGAGTHMRVAGFQREILRTLYDSLATFVSMPAGNGKTTFLAAVALERLCRGDDYAEIDVIATKKEQAGFLVESAKRMVEANPALVDLCIWHSRDEMLEYRPTGSRMQAHPARLSALQGLNFSLAVIDEVGFAKDEHVNTLLARLGKRPDARVIGIGTPGFDHNVLARIRSESLAGALPAGVRYIEHSAPAGCDRFDPKAWKAANPAMGAGFLRKEAIALQAGTLSEPEFRVYVLGQWVDTSTGWLPPGAWDECPIVAPPPDGTDVVIAVDGTYKRTLAVVGATMDGAVFFCWAAEAANDSELAQVLDQAMERWNVAEITHPRRIRSSLFAEMLNNGAPIVPWTTSADEDASSANEFYRAIVEQRVAHDGDELVAAHVAATPVRWTADGSLKLTRPDDGGDVDAAFAARAAWWRASKLALAPPVEAPAIF